MYYQNASIPVLSAASLQSLCKIKWLLKLGWGWRYVRSNTKIAKSLLGPFQGKWNFCWFQGKITFFIGPQVLSHQFVTWYLRSISKTKIVKLFCPCMSEHMIYIKNVTNVTQTLHQNVAKVTKQNIASKEILMIEFHTKYMKLFVNMLSIICVLLNTKFHNTSENIYFEVIWSRTIVAKSQTWPIVTWTLILTLTKNLIFKDLYVLTRTGSTIINQKLVDSMFAPGAVAIQKWNFPLFFFFFWSQTWRWNGSLASCRQALIVL